jgi:hypothetical protein
MLLLSALAGCHATPEVTPAMPAQCTAATRLELVAAWPDYALPNVVSHEKTLQGVALGDLDGDGWLDALMAYGGGSALFRNDGAGGLFLDATATMDGGPLPSAQAVALADLDADGDLDAYLGRDRGESGRILTNDGTGRFTSVALPDSAQAAMTGSFADFDGDGDLDLFVGATVTDQDAGAIADGTVSSGDGDRLFMQQPDGSFSDESTLRLPAGTTHGWTFHGAPLDADEDGDLDLYLSHDMGPYILPNLLLVNDGTGHFTRASNCACELVMFGMGAAVGDANDDGRPDLYLTDIGGPNLLVSAGDGTFIDATAALGASVPPDPSTLTSWGSTFLDLDMDSFPDLAMTFGQLGQPHFAASLEGTDDSWVDGPEQFNVVLRGQAAGGFRRDDSVWETTNERALAVGDLDRDGVPDIVSVGKYFLRQWRTVDSCGPGVTVMLRGAGRNTHALGARVRVRIGGRTVTRWALPSTTGSSSAHELYLGLGGLPHLDGGEVTWPDGRVTSFGPADAGTTVTLDAP